MENFNHIAKNLQLIFTAQSCRNFHQRMLICKFVFEQGCILVNPFNVLLLSL